jgi:hypothetical protein
MRLLRAIDNLMMKALDRLFGTTDSEEGNDPFSKEMYQKIQSHWGHRIDIGDYHNGENLSIECMDCYEIIIDFDRPESEPEEEPTIHEIMLGIMLARTIDEEVKQ